jgi:hypothetical protein
VDDFLAGPGAIDVHEMAHQADFGQVDVLEQGREADHAVHLAGELGRIAQVLQVREPF